jgi:hypothetical protein
MEVAYNPQLHAPYAHTFTRGSFYKLGYARDNLPCQVTWHTLFLYAKKSSATNSALLPSPGDLPLLIQGPSHVSPSTSFVSAKIAVQYMAAYPSSFIVYPPK